jgi:hypothetical protein
MSTLKSINVQHPSSATINIVNDSSGNVAVGNNLTVAGTSTLTGNVAASGTLTVGGAAVIAVAPTAVGNIPFSTNGTTWASTAKIVAGTAVASTSGTSVDFTSIPSWVKRVTVMFNGVSTNGSSPLLVQVGSGSFTTNGYAGAASNITTGVNSSSYTAGCGLMQGNGASAAFRGNLIITNFTSNSWVFSGNGSFSSAETLIFASNITLSGTLDRIRITTVNGTDTFDAGSINILYE